MSDDQQTRALSDDERAELLAAYEGLRVTDVVDGLDHDGYVEYGQFSGFFDVNHLSSDIRPLFRDTETFSHRAVGFANTLRLHPTNKLDLVSDPPERSEDGFQSWKHDWWSTLSGEPKRDAIREGDMLVIEAHDLDVGFIGSANSLGWFDAGAVGVVTNAGCRDTDEVVTQGYPVYATHTSKPNRPGRLVTDAVGVPVNVGGTLVRPNDVVVADGDGVVVVPLERASTVAKYARTINERDSRNRGNMYERMDIEKDCTVR